MEIKSKFQFFRQNNLTYLDSAATTQVPDVVVRAVEQSLEYKGNPSRSSHVVAIKNEHLLNEARENIANFIGATGDEIVFTNNATDSFNLAVDCIADQIKDGDEIVVAISEHHSNMLPYLKLTKKGAKIRMVGIKDGVVDVDEIKKTISTKTKIVAVGHCSNVLGNINDVAEIGAIIKDFNEEIFFIIDGTQAVAHIPVNVKSVRADFYGFSGHKMYGPDGVGVLFVNKDIHHLIAPSRTGGGTVKNVAVTFGKEADIISPDYFQSLITIEGGTPNVSNILGLSKAVNFIRVIGFDELRKHELDLVKVFLGGLANIPEIKVFGPTELDKKIGVVSFGLSEYSTKELGDYLGRQKICIRYGAHCAFPLAEHFGQETLRISLGVYSDEDDINHVLGEIRFFLDKKKGLILNPNLEPLKNKLYYRNTHIVNSFHSIAEKLKQALYSTKDTEIIVMGGHFLGIPDIQENKFWPGIKPLLPERLHGLLEEFGMTNFPIFTWELACKIVADLKNDGYNAKLSIIANDTTGINELRLSSANKTSKTAENYREELLNLFKENDDIPNKYLEILKKYKLGKKDILKNGRDYFFRETILRANFKKFISANKKFFDGVINYSAEEGDNIDLSIKVLDNQEIKTCTFDTFHSKTGGKFCIVELCEFIAELFGKPDLVSFDYLSQKIQKPKVEATHKVLVALTPAMCDNAVTRSAELYSKVFLQEKGTGSFKFFNIPLGPTAERNLAIGAELKYISDKDNLEVLDVEKEPEFSELWRLAEYKLIYDPEAYVNEMTELFGKIGINKKSTILDTCVGPGFFTTELLKLGYSVATSDKNENMIVPFRETLKELGISHTTTLSPWLDLKTHFGNESFDLMLNRGNSFIYGAGGWNREVVVDEEKSLLVFKDTMRIYYDLLKPGGYLYIDKFRDAEIPDKKVVARLNIEKTGEQKDVVFYVERKPENKTRFAQMLLRDKQGNEHGLPNMAYDLSEDEMEKLLLDTGFKTVQRLNLKSERHFVVWLAQK